MQRVVGGREAGVAGTAGRAVRLAGKVLRIAVVVVLAGYVAFNGIGWLLAQRERGETDERLTAALAREVPAADALSATARGLLGEPTASWQAQTCHFPTMDSGWIVSSYSQVCTLASVSVYPAASFEAAREAVAAAGGEQLGPLNDRLAADPPTATCRTLRSTPSGQSPTLTVTWVPPRQTDEQYWCGDTWAPARTESRVLRGQAAALPPQSGSLVVTRGVTLDRVELGCSRWTVLFCGNPFGDRPAWGEPPGA